MDLSIEPRYPLVPPAIFQANKHRRDDDTGDAIVHDVPQITPDIQLHIDMEVAVATTVFVQEKRRKILFLCGGPNSREVSLYNLLVAAGFDCLNYVRLNGQEFDLVDDVVWGEILRDITAGEYVAAFASPVWFKGAQSTGPTSAKGGIRTRTLWTQEQQHQASGNSSDSYIDGSQSGTGIGSI